MTLIIKNKEGQQTVVNIVTSAITHLDDNTNMLHLTLTFLKGHTDYEISVPYSEEAFTVFKGVVDTLHKYRLSGTPIDYKHLYDTLLYCYHQVNAKPENLVVRDFTEEDLKGVKDTFIATVQNSPVLSLDSQGLYAKGIQEWTGSTVFGWVILTQDGSGMVFSTREVDMECVTPHNIGGIDYISCGASGYLDMQFKVPRLGYGKGRTKIDDKHISLSMSLTLLVKSPFDSQRIQQSAISAETASGVEANVTDIKRVQKAFERPMAQVSKSVKGAILQHVMSYNYTVSIDMYAMYMTILSIQTGHRLEWMQGEFGAF